MLEEIQKLSAEFPACWRGRDPRDLEPMSEIFNEYSVSLRLERKTSRGAAGTYADEAGYFAEDLTATTLVKGFLVPDGVAYPGERARTVWLGPTCSKNRGCDGLVAPGSRSRRRLRSCRTFATWRVGIYVVHVEHGIGAFSRVRDCAAGWVNGAVDAVGVRPRALARCAADVASSGSGSVEEGIRQVLPRLGTQQWA